MSNFSNSGYEPRKTLTGWHKCLGTATCTPTQCFANLKHYFLKYPTRIYYKSRHICCHSAIYSYQTVLYCSERPSKSSRNEALVVSRNSVKLELSTPNILRDTLILKSAVIGLISADSLISTFGDQILPIRPFLWLVFMPAGDRVAQTFFSLLISETSVF